MKKLAIITTHPIQYQTPLFKKLAKKLPNLQVFFASRHGLSSKYIDPEFKKNIKWDIGSRMLDGYKSEFSKNQNKNINQFSLNFLNLEKKLIKGNFDHILVLGWNNLLYINAILYALKHKIKLILRVETNLLLKINPIKRLIKTIILKNLFKKINYFLAIGILNKNFLLNHNVPKKKIYPGPYFVDNNFFSKKIKKKSESKKKIVLFVGKLIQRKNPFEFLNLAQMFLKNKKIQFIMIGDGILKKECQKFINKRRLNNVSLIGFVNQTQLKKYYQKSDLLIVPSYYETWGLVINEAFASNIPVICSENCGASKDLILNGKTGFTYPTNELKILYTKTNKILKNKSLSNKLRTNISRKIKDYDVDISANSILKILDEK